MALIASAEEWLARALESVLQPHGYSVLRASSGAETLQRARSGPVDAVLIATDLPDRDSVEVCRALRKEALITPSTPIVLVTATPATREQRLTGLRAGGWDHLAFPLDADELLLKLDAYMQAKEDADRVRQRAFVDEVSGLYSARGVERRARELVADAWRRHAALACVMLAVDARPEMAPDVRTRDTQHHVTSLLRDRGRTSDAIGWWDAVQFAELAPATGAEGATQLARRLSQAIETPLPRGGAPPLPLEVHAGYEAIDDVHATPVKPETLLARARSALRQALAESGGARIRAYSPHGGG